MTQVIYRLKASRRKVSLSDLRDFTNHMSHLDGEVKVQVFNGELEAVVGAEEDAKRTPPSSTGAHLHFDARDAFPRDELGRFVKRR